MSDIYIYIYAYKHTRVHKHAQTHAATQTTHCVANNRLCQLPFAFILPSYRGESSLQSCTRDGPSLAPSVTRHYGESWRQERASASDAVLMALVAQGDELGADLMSTYHEYINLTQIRIDRPLKKTFVLDEHERKHPVGPGRRESLLKRLDAF